MKGVLHKFKKTNKNLVTIAEACTSSYGGANSTTSVMDDEDEEIDEEDEDRRSSLTSALERSSSTTSDDERKKRPRTAFTAAQIKSLEAEFERNKYLSVAKRLQLSKALKLTETQVGYTLIFNEFRLLTKNMQSVEKF